MKKGKIWHENAFNNRLTVYRVYTVAPKSTHRDNFFFLNSTQRTWIVFKKLEESIYFNLILKKNANKIFGI